MRRLVRMLAGCRDAERRAICLVLSVAMVLPSLTWNPTAAYAEEVPEDAAPKVAEGFGLGLNWARASDGTDYEWDATSDESRVIRLNVSYSNESSQRAYAPGEIEFEVPGIGAIMRSGTAQASDVAVNLIQIQAATRPRSRISVPRVPIAALPRRTPRTREVAPMRSRYLTAAACGAACALALSFSTAFADTAHVVWEGDAERFASATGELFGDWGSIMPGDELTGEVSVRNEGETSVLAFVAPAGSEDMAASGMEAFGDVTLMVTDEGGEAVYNGPICTLDGRPILIGELEPSEEENLTFSAEIPETLGNGAARAGMSAIWEFSVMEASAPSPGPDDGNPGTDPGDQTPDDNVPDDQKPDDTVPDKDLGDDPLKLTGDWVASHLPALAVGGVALAGLAG